MFAVHASWAEHFVIPNPRTNNTSFQSDQYWLNDPFLKTQFSPHISWYDV